MRFRDPPASPTRVGAATRPLRCPLRGLISSLAPGARGLGWRKSRPVKVFCPAFLQKRGRGPGAAPGPRAAARGTLLCYRSAGGGIRGNPRRGFPLCGRLRRPQPSRPRGAGGGRRKGSSRTPTPTAGGKRAVCHVIYCEVIPRPGGGRRNGVTPAVTAAAGRRGRRPLRVSARPGRVPRNLPGTGRGGGNSENVAGGGVLISFAVVEDAVPCGALPVSRLYERKMPPPGGIFLFVFWFT